MQNPFDTLGLDPSFALSVEALAERQRELNRAVHPDRHAGKGSAERRQALSRAMDVNQAIRTLKDPCARADALLSLLGENASETASGPTDPALLMEMMEQREALDQVRKSGDAARLDELEAAMSERERTVTTALERAFSPLLARGSGEPGDPDEALLGEVRRRVGELRYLRRFAEEVEAIKDEL